MQITTLDQLHALCQAAAPVGQFLVLGANGSPWLCGVNGMLDSLPGPAVVWGTNPDVGQVQLWVQQQTFPDGHMEPQPQCPIQLPATLVAEGSAPGIPGFTD